MIKTIIYLLFTTLLEIICFHYYILYLKKKQYTQVVREVGPKSHQIKNGTPTAGGIIILVFIILNYIIVKLINKLSFNISDLIFLLTILLFGLLGLLDDLKIINKKNNEGLTPRIKFIIEIVLSIIIFTLLKINNYDNHLQFGNFNIDLSYISIVFVMFYLIAWSNSFNITDGLDGLAGNLSLSVLVGMFIIGKIEKNEILVISSIVMFFSIIAFLCFNFHPALVFMGNVGSHAIGSAIAISAIISKNELYIAIFGLVFVFETLSVILQVFYFRKTNGKRLFKMAPFHHHLEMIGYNEGSISIILVLISILLVIISLLIKGI